MAVFKLKVQGGNAVVDRNIQTFVEGTSETFAVGDLVIQDQSENGLVALANTSGVPDAQDFLGIALTAATNVTSAFKEIDVLIPTHDMVFEAPLASAEGTLVAPTIDDIGKVYGLIKMNSANGSGYAVDNGNTNWVKVINIHPQDVMKRGGSPSNIPTMTAGDRVIFQFQTNVLENQGTQA